MIYKLSSLPFISTQNTNYKRYSARKQEQQNNTTHTTKYHSPTRILKGRVCIYKRHKTETTYIYVCITKREARNLHVYHISYCFIMKTRLHLVYTLLLLTCVVPILNTPILEHSLLGLSRNILTKYSTRAVYTYISTSI